MVDGAMRLGWALGLILTLGCSSAGPYGYSRTYSPADGEEDATEGAREYDPVMVDRFPAEWKASKVTLFGVVQERQPGPAGKTRVTLSMRTLSERNLCDTADEATCRVTVSDREHATVHALVQLERDDDLGKLRVSSDSLLRIVGRIADRRHQDGTPVILVDYYRHWPPGQWVTTSAASHMRR
ncbi:MAG TPA: hypothetical protein VKZ49_18065 [Polyangiaceae bacterium]|nr:hypothetical protein [Polyangiaceae bacterium]